MWLIYLGVAIGVLIAFGNILKQVMEERQAIADAANPRRPLNEITKTLDSLRVSIWRADDKTKRVCQKLAAYDPRQWREKFDGNNEDPVPLRFQIHVLLEQEVREICIWVDAGYKQMANPDINVDPAYRAEFEAKVQEVRDFLASVGNRQTRKN